MNELHLQAPQLPETKVFFVASLSNGEIITEGRGDWEWVDNLPSPWNRLITYSVKNKLTITSLSLSTPHGATFTLPPLGGKPRFKGYNPIKEEERPIDYEVRRFLARDLDVGVKDNKATVEGVQIAEFYTIAEAIYPDFSIQLWVNELNTRNSWVTIKKI